MDSLALVSLKLCILFRLFLSFFYLFLSFSAFFRPFLFFYILFLPFLPFLPFLILFLFFSILFPPYSALLNLPCLLLSFYIIIHILLLFPTFSHLIFCLIPPFTIPQSFISYSFILIRPFYVFILALSLLLFPYYLCVFPLLYLLLFRCSDYSFDVSISL